MPFYLQMSNIFIYIYIYIYIYLVFHGISLVPFLLPTPTLMKYYNETYISFMLS